MKNLRSSWNRITLKKNWISVFFLVWGRSFPLTPTLFVLTHFLAFTGKKLHIVADFIVATCHVPSANKLLVGILLLGVAGRKWTSNIWSPFSCRFFCVPLIVFYQLIECWRLVHTNDRGNLGQSRKGQPLRLEWCVAQSFATSGTTYPTGSTPAVAGAICMQREAAPWWSDCRSLSGTITNAIGGR